MLDFGNQRNLPTVLLIDDDLVSREVMATVLTMDGFTVHTASGGNEALDLLGSGACNPGVILMDAQMPGLSGAKLIAKLRASSRASVYVVSGSGAPSKLVAAADGFLQKPISPDALQKLLKNHGPHSASFAAESPSQSLAPSVSAGGILPLGSEPDNPVVKAETLAQLREMMPEPAVRQIYAAVVADLFKRLGLLEAAVSKGDNAEVRRIGHAIKGGCGMTGAMEAARIGALLESGINHSDNNSTLLKDLRSAALNLERMLKAEFPA